MSVYRVKFQRFIAEKATAKNPEYLDTMTWDVLAQDGISAFRKIEKDQLGEDMSWENDDGETRKRQVVKVELREVTHVTDIDLK